MPYRKFIIFAMLLLLSSSALGWEDGGSPLPDITLEITVQNQWDGKLDPAVFVHTLECRQGKCSLTTLYLDCKANSVFYPKIWHYNDLRVKKLDGNNLEVQYAIEKDVINTLHFGFDTTLGYPKVNSFSGGYVAKQHDRISVVKLLPLVAPRGLSDVTIPMHCNALLPGLKGN